MKKYFGIYWKKKQTKLSSQKSSEIKWVGEGMKIIKELGYKPDNLDKLIAERLKIKNPFK